MPRRSPDQPPATRPEGVRITMRGDRHTHPPHAMQTYVVTPEGEVYVEFTMQTFCAGHTGKPPRVTWRRLRDGPTRTAVRAIAKIREIAG